MKASLPPYPNATPIPEFPGRADEAEKWIAADKAMSLRTARMRLITAGLELPLVSAGRYPEAYAAEVRGTRWAHLNPDPHEAGRAVDVDFHYMDDNFPGWDRDLFDRIMGEEGWHHLDASRPGDPNHYQTDDYHGTRAIGEQRFPSLTAAVDWLKANPASAITGGLGLALAVFALVTLFIFRKGA